MKGVFQLSSPVTLNNAAVIGTAGTWVRDISLATMGVPEGDVPEGATGVLFEVRNTSSTAHSFGIQSADVADDLTASSDNFITRVFVPLNATRTFDIYCGSLASVVFKVIAYDNVVNHVAPVDLSPQVLNGTEWDDAGVDGINPGNVITVGSAPEGCKFALLEVRASLGMKLYAEGHSTVANNGLHAVVSHVVLPLSAAKSFWMHTGNYRAANGRTFPDNGLRFIGWIPEQNYEYRPLAKRERSYTSQNGSWQLFPDSAFGLSMASFEHAGGSTTYGWALSATASGGEWWNKEPKADMWFAPDADGNVWIYRTRSSEQGENYSAKLTGGFVNTPDGYITSVGGGSSLTAGATAVPVVGAGLTGATYARLVLHAPSTHAHTTQALAISAVSDTGCSIDAVTLGKMPYTDADHIIKLQILNASNAVLAERIITLLPPAGYALMTAADADALAGAALGVLKPLPARSQVLMPATVTHGGSARAVEYELSAAGNWTGVVSLGAYQPTSSVTLEGGTYRAGDATDATGGWESLDLTLLVSTASDTTPNAFGFAAVTGVAPGTLQTSAPVTPTGYDTAATITVVGGEYRIDTGGWTNAAGTISPGSAVQVRFNAPGDYSSTGAVALNIGGTVAEFAATTMAEPAPVLSGIGASASGASIAWSVTTDTAAGGLRVLASTNELESAATVEAIGEFFAVAESGPQAGTLVDLADGDYYVHIVHVHTTRSAVSSTSAAVTVDTAAPAIAAGITIGAVTTLATFDVSGTAGEDCTVDVVVTSTRVQPGDATFDASTYTTAATAGVQWSVSVAGAEYARTAYAHIRLQDAAGNNQYYVERVAIPATAGGRRAASAIHSAITIQ